MDSDEEERLRLWKQHLASQQDNWDDDSPPEVPASVAAPPRESRSGRGRPPSGGLNSSRHEMARDSLAELDSGNQPATADEIDWKEALMPQMRELQMENQTLYARFQAQEKEIKRLRLENQAVAEVPRPGSSGMANDLKEAKIVELAKKNRTLNVALEKERAKNGRMTADIARLTKELDDTSKIRDLSGADARSLPASMTRQKDGKENEKKKPMAFGTPVDPVGEDEEMPPEMKVKELQSKLAAMNNQIGSQRVANDKLKQELGKVKEVLKKELGDVPVDKALDEAGGWTGRAQQISLLQSKIVNLKRELAEQSRLRTEGPTPNDSVSSPGKQSALAGPGSPSQDSAMKLDEKHRKEIEKIDRDRRREADVLQDELMREKAEKDSLKKKYSASASRVKNLEEDCKDLREKIQVLLTKTDNDDNLISALQAEMQNLIKKAKEERKTQKMNEQGAVGELQDLREQFKDKEAQLERQQKIIMSLRAELQAAVMRGEDASRGAAVNELEEANITAATQKLRVVEVQNSKLTEFTEVLKRRLAEAEEKLHSAHVSLRQERQKTVELERRAESRPGSNSSHSSRLKSAGNAYPPEKVQQLVDRLNSTTEEIEALQDSFKRTLEVKEEELRSAREMLKEQQQVFDQSNHALQRQLHELQRKLNGGRSR